MESTIQEGTEYQIVRLPDNRVIYSGIAESDSEAEERLEAYAMQMRMGLNVPYAITLKIEKL